ncbi:hypothetical protein SRHO_G00140520 [Serrasalmus rhombeus]
MRKQGRTGGKIEPDFSGPYVIRSICGKVVTLSNSDGATLKNKYSVNHIKPYRRSQNDDRQVPTEESHKIPKENETRTFSDGSNSLTMGRDLESITKDISLPQRPSVVHFAPKKETQVCDATTEFECCGLQKTVVGWKQLLDHINCMIHPSVHCMGLSGLLMMLSMRTCTLSLKTSRQVAIIFK